MEWLEHLITGVLADYGYIAVFVLMTLESACIPVPSELTMVFGGFLVSRGRLDFTGVALAGTLGNVLGSWIAWWVGARGGRPLIERWGRYVFLRPHEIDRAERWFERRGEAAVFVSRLLPVIRTFISLPAGVARMPWWRFTLYTVLGCLPWCFLLTWAGVLLGDHWESFIRYGRPISFAVAAITAALIGRWLWRRARARRAEAPTDGGSPQDSTPEPAPRGS